MNLNTWKQFLNENKTNTEDLLLLEARVKDIKKKYPVWDEAGWLDGARARINDTLGPKGVSKYLLWIIRELDRNFADEEPEGIKSAGLRSDILDVMNELLEDIFWFQENQARIEEKDIYKYNAGTIQDLMSSMGASRSQRDEKEKKAALQESEVVYDSNDVFAVRPLSEGASCYFGRNTKWCISATETENWFNKYTSEDNQAFIMLRLNHLKGEDPAKKIALVYSRDGHFEEAYDAPDRSHTYEWVIDALARNYAVGRKIVDADGDTPEYMDDLEQILGEDAAVEVRDEFNDIFGNAEHSVMENPPIPNYEDQAEKIEAEYDFNHAHANFEFDGEYFYFSGGLSVEFPEGWFEGGEYELPSGWREEGEFSSNISDKLGGLGIYPDETNIHHYGDNVEIHISAGTGNYTPDPDGYRQFLEYEIQPLEEKHDEIIAAVKNVLMDEGFAPHNEYHKLLKKAEEIEQEMRIMRVEFADHEMIVLAARPNVPLEFNLEGPRDQGLLSNPSRLKENEERITDYTVKRLKDLDMKLRKYLEKQLELPISDLPPKVLAQLSIPDSFSLKLDKSATDNLVTANPRIKILHHDSDVLVAEAVAIAKYLEDNYDTVQKAFTAAMQDFIQDYRSEVYAAVPTAAAPASSPAADTSDDVFQEHVDKYFNSLISERSRQYDIYEFYLMLGYSPQKDEDDKIRGLEHIVADIRAIPSVTVVSIKVKNQRISETDYIAGLKIKFIPSLPGVLRSPEDAKLRILQMIKATKGVRRIFKVSPRFEKSTV